MGSLETDSWERDCWWGLKFANEFVVDWVFESIVYPARAIVDPLFTLD